MATTRTTKTLRGRCDAPPAFAELDAFFDACFGPGKRSLPEYPKAIGHVTANWQEKSRAIKKAESLEELRSAYEACLTYSIGFNGYALPDPPEQLAFTYRPGLGDATIDVTSSSDAVLERILSHFARVFPLPLGCVFVSYDTRELKLADYLKALLESRLGRGIPIFVAKKDIKVGDDPTKKMITDSLLCANVVVSICTPASKTSPWLAWETATVWARRQLVIPLFAGILPKDFGGPVAILLQGRDLFDREELTDAIKEIGRLLLPSAVMNGLTEREADDLQSLREWHKSLDLGTP